jgi:hypothetical protein
MSGLRDYSIEFCGGTHVGNTDKLVDLVVVEESGIAKGVSLPSLEPSSFGKKLAQVE